MRGLINYFAHLLRLEVSETERQLTGLVDAVSVPYLTNFWRKQMIKLRDAIHRMNIGEWFCFSETDADEKIIKITDSLFEWDDGATFTLENLINAGEMEGIIIPADPKILSTTELWEKVRKNAGNYEYYRSDDIDYAILISQENARLEMWLEFKKYFTEKDCLFGTHFDNAIQKLKP